ncbi:MAG: SAM-dependent methyltransferase [Alcaligenaceae bacterium]|nr:SAM-dependent methyltransferase [Alcaligenaceae bacterium]
MSKTLHLIPVPLGQSDNAHWLPASVQRQASQLRCFIVENAKTARAFLKQMGTEHAIQDITLYQLDKRGTPKKQIQQWLQSPAASEGIGLMSEAGCPAVADPGAVVVTMAHELGFQVKAHVGPSSILLGLMASGLDGQNFCFHGYVPKQSDEQVRTLKLWEQQSKKHQQSQIFIETPYRNPALFDALLKTLEPSTRLCVARALTTEEEWVKTYTVSQWRNQPPPELNKLPTLFLFQAYA